MKLQDFLWFTRNSRAAGGPHSLISSCGRDLINKLAWPLRESPMRSLWLGSSRHFRLIIEWGLLLKNLILKIRSRVNDRRSLWGKLLSSMIRLCLNVTYVNFILKGKKEKGKLSVQK